MDDLYELFDSKTDRLAFVGTEAECIEFTKTEPRREFYFEHKKNKEEKKDMSEE